MPYQLLFCEFEVRARVRNVYILKKIHKMGRKIPGRKHRGVKDPEKQREERFARIKDKVDAPPTHPDNQEVSKSLTRIIELKNKVKSGLYNKKKNQTKQRRNVETQRVKKFKGRPEKPIPEFVQNPGESDRTFRFRVNRVCQEIIKEAAYEDKYGIDVKRNEHGEVEGIVKRSKDDLAYTLNGKKKGKKEDTDKRKLTKSQKWALKKAEKKKRKVAEKDDNYLPQKDHVKFGEIVHKPPSLTVPKKVKNADEVPRPGKKNLLLKSLLNKEQHKTATAIDRKGKRKELPVALRRQLDKQQKEIVEAYKNLKSKNRSR